MGLNKVKIKIEYYTVEQLADHWIVSSDDIVHLGLTNKLKLNAVAKFQYSQAKITKYNCHLPLSNEELAAVFFHKKDYLIYGEISLVFDCSHKPIELHLFMESILNYGWLAEIIGKELIISSKLFNVTVRLDDRYIITIDNLTITHDKKNNTLILKSNEEIEVSYCADISRLIIYTDDVERYENKNSIEQSSKVINDHNRYKARDNDFKAWISETKSDIANMKKVDIHEELIKRNSRLWASGFSHWWEKREFKEDTRLNTGRRKTNKPT
ncbi:MAG: hypothetical protein NTW85_16285 [Methylococcales bacterium]|nr:hypothetical protein [Methylococcales bacterium]